MMNESPDPKTKTLIMTVGLQCSGKSTWAKTQDCPRVESDAIRFALRGMNWIDSSEDLMRAIEGIMIHALFNAGHDTVILDECNHTKELRDRYNLVGWNIRYEVFKTDFSTCMSRVKESNQDYLVEPLELFYEEADFWEM